MCLTDKRFKEYYRAAIQAGKGDSRKLCQYLRDLAPKDTKLSPVSLIDNDETITDPEQIANIFNNFFSTIADKYITNNTEHQTNHTNLRPDDYFTVPLMTKDYKQGNWT